MLASHLKNFMWPFWNGWWTYCCCWVWRRVIRAGRRRRGGGTGGKLTQIVGVTGSLRLLLFCRVLGCVSVFNRNTLCLPCLGLSFASWVRTLIGRAARNPQLFGPTNVKTQTSSELHPAHHLPASPSHTRHRRISISLNLSANDNKLHKFRTIVQKKFQIVRWILTACIYLTKCSVRGSQKSRLYSSKVKCSGSICDII